MLRQIWWYFWRQVFLYLTRSPEYKSLLFFSCIGGCFFISFNVNCLGLILGLCWLSWEPWFGRTKRCPGRNMAILLLCLPGQVDNQNVYESHHAVRVENHKCHIYFNRALRGYPAQLDPLAIKDQLWVIFLCFLAICLYGTAVLLLIIIINFIYRG